MNFDLQFLLFIFRVICVVPFVGVSSSNRNFFVCMQCEVEVHTVRQRF